MAGKLNAVVADRVSKRVFAHAVCTDARSGIGATGEVVGKTLDHRRAVTDHWRAATSSARADVRHCAGVGVIAHCGVYGKYTASRGIARVVGAEIAVVAHDQCARTCPITAHIPCCAGVSIVANYRVCGVHTPGAGITRIVSAEITVVTGDKDTIARSV